jgi:tetratricopeptide (TPR) repeat protein
MGRATGPQPWKDLAASYLALGCVASREEHDDLARSLFEKAFAALKEGSSGSELLERSIKLCRRVHYAEDLNAAALYFARCAAHARTLGEVTFYIQAMYYRGCIAVQQGDFAAANRHLEECLIYYGEAGPARRLGRTLTEKGAALFAVGDESKGRTYMNKALEIARAEKDDVGAAAALTALGTWIPNESDGSFEHECLVECTALSGVHSERYPHRAVTHHLGDMLRRRGEVNDACRLYLKCIIIMGQEGRLMAATAAIEGLAIAASAVAMHNECVRLLSRACTIRRRTGSAPTEQNGREIDAATSAARGKLNARDFDTAWAEGEVFSIRDTVRQAWSIVESCGIISWPD